jgi:exosortase
VRHVTFGLLVGMTSALVWTRLSALVRLSLRDESHSHIVLVPLISASLFLLGRERIFAHVETQWRGAMALMLGGALLYSLAPGDFLSVSIVALVLMWTGAFALCYGLRALRAGLFPALFLSLMVPVPDPLLNRVIVWLQQGSADVSYVIFRLLGVPVSRSGFIFDLPGVTIEVAEECSGIRSSVALLIISLLAGHLFLRSSWTKTALLLATLPLLVIKNGIRIVTLSLLSIYVDPGFLTGRLHRQGGIVFFLLTLVLLVPAVALLQRAERGTGPGLCRSMNTTPTA